jgi:hypothetical protein
MMIGRRAMLVNTASLTIAGSTTARAETPIPQGQIPPGQIPPGKSLAFRLMRHGNDIGRHTVTFEQSGAALTVHVTVDALVTLVSVPIVRYTHRVTETWRSGVLTSLIGETDKNGTREWVKAQREAAGLSVTGSKTEPYVAPEPAGATTYWNKHVLAFPMISLEDGALLRPKVTPAPIETIPLASGATVAADRYNLSGAFNVDLWYDRSGTWASMAFTGPDGSVVRYERL